MIQSQSEKPVFSCILTGSTNLLIECYELLKGRNWDIVAVFTNDIPVSNYFNSLEVPVTSNTESIFPSLKKKRFDYLFSIVNEHILPKEILSIPEKGAINYHDSCLPEGAGVYATTWAIINKHKTHGITWHLMDEGIDTGEILEQKIIDIAPEDTSFVLNAKCFAEAIDSFKILLDNIEMGSLHPKKQDLIKRTYYPFNKRPQNFGFIDFRAEESLWEPNLRAFYFGKNDNFFCTPKVCLKGHIYVLNGYNWNNDKLPFEPGQIKIIDNAILQVKCTKRVLNIKKLTTLFGEVVSIQDLIKYHCLKEGDRFEYPDSTFLDSLFQYTKSAISEEKNWINRLTHLDLADFPMQNVIHYETDSVNKPIYSFPLNEETFQLCMNSNNNGFFSNCTALLLMFISRLLDRANYDIWFQSNSVGSILASCYSAKVPLNVTLNKTRNCMDTLNECSDTIFLVSKKPSFCLDIFQRIRYLKETDQKALFRRKPFLIEWQNDSSCERVDENIDWKLVISEKKKTIDLISSKNVVNHAIGKIFFHHFKVFIRNLVQWPQQTLGSIKMLSDDELSTKIFEYNNLKVPYPDSKCVNELINEWIEKTPGEVALVCEGRQLTYGSLGEKANRISHCLHSLNVNPGELIGIKMKRSENVIISYLAIWNMGCAYVPLDPELPGTRIQYMIDNANVKIVITDDDNDEFNVASLNFNHALSSPIADKPLLLPGKKPALAYVKYTSGSTGLPKGVMISHENIIVFLYSYREVVGVKNKRIGTCVAPLSFDTSVDEIYSCICFGGTAHIMMKQQVLDLSYFSNYLADNKINVSYIIPEFLEGVGKHLKNQPQVFLKTILTGLHAKKNRAFKNFFGLSSEIRVLNAYGPTEVTYGSSAYRVSGTEPGDEYTPIGKPFPNYQTFIVDSEMHILPDFVAGELLIAGSALSSGYINNSETTREKFVDFSYGDSKTRVYKTGDRVCYLPSGDVAFIGRNDDQVKISGYRIELGEIEEALLKISNIRQSLVLTKNIGSLGYRIMAYIVFENKSEADVQQVESELKSRLPAYMVPSFFVPLDKIPQFPNGKINFHALPDPNLNQQKPGNRIIPVNETEKKLKHIFEKHLGVGEIGVHDNFFDIGGDSLSAVHIMQEIDEQFQRHIPISLLYRFPTVKKMAIEIMFKTFEGRRDSLIGINENGDLSPIFFIHSRGGSVLMYNEIIQQLDKRHPVFGIQSSYDDTLDLTKNSVKTIAKGYVEEILKIVHSRRKLYIAGFSYGGVMAFEIACWLQKIGHPHKLIILDTRMNNYRRKFHPRMYNVEEHLIFLFWMIKYIIRMVLDIVIRRNIKMALGKYNHLKFEIFAFKQARKNKKHIIEPGGMDIEIAKVSYKLSENYKPGIYKGDIYLIQCVGGNNGKVFNKTMTNYYRSFVKGKIRKYHVNAYHIDMLKQERGKRVAEIINKIITQDTVPD